MAPGRIGCHLRQARRFSDRAPKRRDSFAMPVLRSALAEGRARPTECSRRAECTQRGRLGLPFAQNFFTGFARGRRHQHDHARRDSPPRFAPSDETQGAPRKLSAKCGQRFRRSQHVKFFWHHGDAAVPEDVSVAYIPECEGLKAYRQEVLICLRRLRKRAGKIVQNVIKAFAAALRMSRSGTNDDQQNRGEPTHHCAIELDGAGRASFAVSMRRSKCREGVCGRW